MCVETNGMLERATACKERGNKELQAKDLEAAIGCYGEGIESLSGVTASAGTPELQRLKSQLHSNRAQAFLQSSGKEADCVEDCKAAISLDAENAKAYWRGATAFLRLESFQAAVDFCRDGLKACSGGSQAQLEELLTEAMHKMCLPERCPICLDKLGPNFTLAGGSAEPKSACDAECIAEMRFRGVQDAFPHCWDEQLEAGSGARLAAEGVMHLVRACERTRCGRDPEAALPEAEELLLKALEVDAENVVALENLGDIYSGGLEEMFGSNLGVEAKPEEARRLWEKAGDAGSGNCNFKLGIIHYHGQGVAEDKVRGIEFWGKAATKNHLLALHELGLCYDKGHVVSQDYKKAAGLYEKAVAKGHPPSQHNLAMLYRQGLGVTQDFAKAAELEKLAVTKGHVDALFNLGVQYSQGLGVEADADKAQALWEKAAKKGHQEAAAVLHSMEQLQNMG
eukprot:TRINITY_DN113705_c0_g1_i1.p1 TRINITY_DN113705_c0_g1~~TRINITY_DN113705_c0_g1_i1.p1  ORF type:complete len:454 (+),score=155.12 TRINITY_DN113705_c0_g1_i1:74-1435(+)